MPVHRQKTRIVDMEDIGESGQAFAVSDNRFKAHHSVVVPAL
jgi:hypothetical protein